MKLPADARRRLEPLARRADGLGLPLFAVGGCVRDWLRGRKTYDLDLTCEGDPAPLARLAAEQLGGTVEAFGRFGTLRVLSPEKFRFDFATTRRETYPEPAALPVVQKPAPIEKDLERRDFTVNAMALKLNGADAGRLVDPFGGVRDLKAGRLRLLHDQSLRDDPTRAFRAARYACRLSLAPDADLERQVRAALEAGHAARLSPHRVTQELLRVLGEPDPACPLSLLERWGYASLYGAGLPAPPKRLKGVEERLGAIALALGKGGPNFINRLVLDRKLSGDLHELMKLVSEGRVARDEMPAAAKTALKAVMPKLPASAYKPLMLAGEDLKALGMTPGPAFKGILDEAAARQWRGELKTRAQALAWARKAAGRG